MPSNRPETPAPADPPAIEQQLLQAASLASKFKESEALALYQEVLKGAPSHYQSLWQAAVLSVKIGSRYSDETRKTAYFNAARSYAYRALLSTAWRAVKATTPLPWRYLTKQRFTKLGLAWPLSATCVRMCILPPSTGPTWPKPGSYSGAAGSTGLAHYNLLERLYSKLGAGRRAPGRQQPASHRVPRASALKIAPSQPAGLLRFGPHVPVPGSGARRAHRSIACRRKDSSHHQRRAGSHPAVPQNAATPATRRCPPPKAASQQTHQHPRVPTPDTLQSARTRRSAKKNSAGMRATPAACAVRLLVQLKQQQLPAHSKPPMLVYTHD